MRYVYLLLLVGCTMATNQSSRAVPGVDHIMLGVANLEDGIREFENATGVAPVRGGRHPLRGTENALVSLGDKAYLEIIATRADATSPDDFENYLRTLETLTIVGWAIHVDDISDARDRIRQLGFQAEQLRPGSRITPSGEKLEWTTVQIENRLGTTPFFIQWSPSTIHPATSSPQGCALVSFDVEDPNAADLSRLFGAFGLSVRSTPSSQPQMRLQLRCGTGVVSFQSVNNV